MYRPFALARALTLLASLPEDEQTLAAVTRQELLSQLDREIAGMHLLPQPVLYAEDSPLTLVSVMISDVHFGSGGRSPLLALWEDRDAPSLDPTGASFSSSNSEDSVLLLKRTNSVLQLQWVENLVYWDSVERLRTGVAAVPGWTDTARDWFGLRSNRATRIEKDIDGNSFLSIGKPTWTYSVPIRVRDGVGYLLAGSLKGSQSKGSLSWQFMNDVEDVLFNDTIFDDESSDTWTRRAGYIRPQLHWDILRVQLNVMRHAGTVAFDDIMLLEINEPDPSKIYLSFQ